MNNKQAFTFPTVVAIHDDFLVCYKPAGMSFHQEEVNQHNGFVEAIRAHLRTQATSASNAINPDSLLPIHRLDRITSGLILLARHPDAARDLGAMFAQGQMEKFYLALSARPPSKKQGWVKGRMEKGRNGAWYLLPTKSGVAKDQVASQTLSSVENTGLAITQFFSYGLGKVEEAQGYTLRLFIVKPRTGRTHQIRVALKSLGSPILGDQLYGGMRINEEHERAYLHAYALNFLWKGNQQYFLLPPEGGLFSVNEVQKKLQEIGLPQALKWPSS